MTQGGTLWSWPGQNPFRYRDPSGRDYSLGGISGASIGASILAISARYSLMLQQRYAQFEDMALGIEESASAAHAGMYSVLGATPLTDLTNVVVDALGEAGRRTGEVFVGVYLGAVIVGRWVAETSQVARRAGQEASKRPRGSNTCRCTFRYGWDAPSSCPDRAYAQHPDIGTCQEMAKMTAPLECRRFYGHCGYSPD